MPSERSPGHWAMARLQSSVVTYILEPFHFFITLLSSENGNIIIILPDRVAVLSLLVTVGVFY